MTNEQFEEYYPRFTRAINAIARKIAGTDDVLCDDLTQVGRIALWSFDLTSVRSNETGCINRHVRNRMIDHIRSESGRTRRAVTDDTPAPHLDNIYLDEDGTVNEVPSLGVRHAHRLRLEDETYDYELTDIE